MRSEHWLRTGLSRRRDAVLELILFRSKNHRFELDCGCCLCFLELIGGSGGREHRRHVNDSVFVRRQSCWISLWLWLTARFWLRDGVRLGLGLYLSNRFRLAGGLLARKGQGYSFLQLETVAACSL
jgi:hypothetical protein